MSEPVEAVLFDVDDTLCTYRRPDAELLADYTLRSLANLTPVPWE